MYCVSFYWDLDWEAEHILKCKQGKGQHGRSSTMMWYNMFFKDLWCNCSRGKFVRGMSRVGGTPTTKGPTTKGPAASFPLLRPCKRYIALLVRTHPVLNQLHKAWPISSQNDWVWKLGGSGLQYIPAYQLRKLGMFFSQVTSCSKCTNLLLLCPISSVMKWFFLPPIPL